MARIRTRIFADKTISQTVLPVAIWLLALALRIRGLDTTGLWGDQAFTLNTAMRWVNGGEMPLAANKASVGFVNPPMIEYLYAVALRLWGDILSVSILTLLGGLAAVAITGFVTARLFTRRAGLWAMLAFAVAPWAVFWSQLIWNQTMVPPFAALALGGLLLYLAERPRPAYLVVAFAAAAAMTQVHPGTAVQVGAMGLALLLFRRRVRWSHVATGAAVFALLYLPYLLYLAGTGWADLRAVGDVAGQETTISIAAWLLSLDLIQAQGLHRAVPWTTTFDNLAAAVFLVALLLTVGRWWRARDDRPDEPQATGRPSEWVALSVIFLWFLLPLLFYSRSSVYLQNYYLLGQWPAHFMLLGIGLDTAQRAAGRLAARATTSNGRRGWTAVGLLLPALFLAMAAFQVFYSIRFQDARAAGDGSRLQVRHARAVITTSRDLLAERPGWRLVGMGNGHQIENSDLALLQEFVDPARVTLADSELALPLPPPPAIYLDSRPGTLASYSLMGQAIPLPDATVPVNDQDWQFYEWPEPEGGAESRPIARWDGGLDLIGYFPGELVPGQPVTFILTWEAAGEPDASYHFGFYLIDENDAVVAQHDGPGFDSVQWRAGGRFVTFHTVTIPQALPGGDYRTAVALYSWPDLVRSDLIGGGNTAFLETFDFARP